jgi:hypothetical protein
VPRALTVQRTVVTPAQRAAFVERLRARRDHYRGAGCHYWVFEEVDLGGSFIEFVEAADAATLGAALTGAPDPPTGSRIYHELEMD